MIAKFSVKKPYTVMVGVVLVLILGIVSFTRMTPDLLPSINLPYALVTTTYIGATPEEVEQNVTKPIEQSMATLSGISSIQSVSAENYSMVILEFQETVNMDTKTVEMREHLDAIAGYWDDRVGTPAILKINPDMLPVVVAAVDMEGMDAEEITSFLDDKLLPKLEGTEGVASVSASGKIKTQLNVLLSQKKIEQVNQKIRDGITAKLDDAIKDLEDARAELASTREQLEAANAAFLAGASEASQGFAQARMEIMQGELTITAAETEIANQENMLYTQMAALTGTTYTDLDSLESALIDMQAELQARDEDLKKAEAAMAQADAQMEEIWNNFLASFVDENGNLINPFDPQQPGESETPSETQPEESSSEEESSSPEESSPEESSSEEESSSPEESSSEEESSSPEESSSEEESSSPEESSSEEDSSSAEDSSSSGEGNPPEGSGSSGEDNPSEGSSSSGEGNPSEGSSSSGEGNPPEGSSSSGEGNPPEGSGSSGEGNPPKGSSSSGESNPPEGSGSSGEGNPPEGSGSSGESNPSEGNGFSDGGRSSEGSDASDGGRSLGGNGSSNEGSSGEGSSSSGEETPSEESSSPVESGSSQDGNPSGGNGPLTAGNPSATNFSASQVNPSEESSTPESSSSSENSSPTESNSANENPAESSSPDGGNPLNGNRPSKTNRLSEDIHTLKTNDQAPADFIPLPHVLTSNLAVDRMSYVRFEEESSGELPDFNLPAGPPTTWEELVAMYEAWTTYWQMREQLPQAREQLDAAMEGVNGALEGIKALRAAKQELAGAREQLEIGKSLLNEQESAVNSQLGAAGSQISEGLSQVIDGQSQVDTALEQMDDTRETALENADITQAVTMETIAGILTAQNFALPAGYVKEGGVSWLIRVGDKLRSEEELSSLVLFDMGIEDMDPIYLTDVADVYYSNNAAETYAKLNGIDAVLLSFSKQSNYSTAEVSDNVNATFRSLTEAHPGLRFTMLSDQGDYIDLVVGTVLKNLMYGAFLAILVLILFLKDVKPTLVIACSIPISVVFAFVLMYFSNITLNVISLSGLAIGVGMLVDNSVVVIENIYRLRNKGVPAAQAAVSGTVQVLGSITASTLTTVCVFLPIVFIQGITKELFTDMALTIAYSLFASLIVAMTLVPAMSSGLLKNAHEKPHRLFDVVMKGYRGVLNGCLNHRFLTLFVAVDLLVISIMAAVKNGTGFMPAMDSTQVSVNITMPEESEWEDCVEMTDQVAERILTVPGVESVGAMIGGSLFSARGGGSSDNSSTIYVILSEEKELSSQEVAKRINNLCEDLEADVSASGSASMDLSSLSGSGVSIRVMGNDLDDLRNTAMALADRLSQVEGIAEADSGIEDPTPELRITVNKNEGAKQGLMVAQVYQEIAKALSTSTTATTLVENNNEYSVIVTDEGKTEMTLDDIRSFTFTVTDRNTGEEKTVALKDIATITETEALSSISRYEQNRYLTVRGTLADGYNIGLVSQEVERELAKVDLPDGVSLVYSGENETINEAFRQLGLMLILALAFIYLIMVAQFQSLKSPFIVMFTIPLAFTGGFMGLWALDMEVSVIALLGFVMLSGIVVNNGIVLVDFVNQLRAEGTGKREALLEAGVTRMRPILMTAITTILGLLTMAMGVGMGSEMMQPIAVVTIGGLSYATFMTLFVVPVMYDLLNRKELHVLSDEELQVVDL